MAVKVASSGRAVRRVPVRRELALRSYGGGLGMEGNNLSEGLVIAEDEFGERREPPEELPEGFDEAAYLRAFPDVALAVAAGDRRSGLDHYLEFGREEGRLSDLRYLSATSAGVIELYGRQEAAESWVFAGWVGQAWSPDDKLVIDATFERGTVKGSALVAFYRREGIPAQGAGFIAVVSTPQRRLGRLTGVELQFETIVARLYPMPDARELQGRALHERAAELAIGCEACSSLPAITERVGRRFVGEGYIDSYGYHVPSAGWFVCGWVSNEWIAYAMNRGEVTAQFEGGHVSGASVLNFYEREDLRGRGVGFIAHIATVERELGRLLVLGLRADVAVVLARPAASIDMLAPDATAASFQGLILHSDHGPAREQLRDLVARVAHDGRDTVASLSDRVLIEFDEIISCAPAGVVVIGWMLAHPGVIRTLRLCSATHVFPLDMSSGMHWIARADVIDSTGYKEGFTDPNCGFIAFVPTPHHNGGKLHLEIETSSGEVGHKNLPASRLTGMAAIKRLLSEVDTQYKDVEGLYDHIFGPSIRALSEHRLAVRPSVDVLSLGHAVASPRFSVIVTLYGRIDFMEMQMALFATLGLGDDVELIYVLDDPPKTREAQRLADSLHARFKLPFMLLCLSRNMGFAPANNIGLAAARGKFICFLNSDVLPNTGDWLTRLAGRLEADLSLGVVGPLLLFEDGSVQHQGIYFKKLPQFGNWWFPHHTRKGLKPPSATGLLRQHAITGAAMLLRHETARAFGGFDEAFVIGDFEDTDLCFKLAQSGLGAAVDLGVTMYHLERKSQANSASQWRLNLTLYNAWLHQKRRAKAIGELPHALPS